MALFMYKMQQAAATTLIDLSFRDFLLILAMYLHIALSDKGHSAGQKMCISAHDFLSAIREMGPDCGPKVHLHGTHERALEVVKLGDLKKFAASSAGATARGGSL